MHKNGRADLRLTEQIHNKIKMLFGFDMGTTSKLSKECGLGRGNQQWLAVLDWFSKP